MARLMAMQRAFCSALTFRLTSAGCVKRNSSRSACSLTVSFTSCAAIFLRARMTAVPLAACSGITIEESSLLQERNFGDLRGVPYVELTEDPFGPDFVPPNGEDWPRFHARVAEAFALILSRRRGVYGTLVVVTHGLVCRALVERHALVPEGISVPATFDNTSVTGLHENAPHAVTLINCTRHLVTSLEISGAPA